MKYLILILIITFSLSLNAQTPPAPPQNIFMQNGGELAHELSGQAIGMIVGWVVFKHTKLTVWKGMAACVLAGAAAGAAKEYIYDKYLARGVVSLLDFANTLWGAFVGAICLVPAMILKIDKTFEWEEKYGDIGTNIFVHPSDSLHKQDTVWIELPKPIKN